MRIEEYMAEGVVLEGKDTDIAVTARGCQVTASFRRRPGDNVDGGGVEGEFVDALPLCILLAPDQDAAVVGGGCEDGAVFGVCPRDAPDCSFVTGSMLVKPSKYVVLVMVNTPSTSLLAYVDHLQSRIF